MNTVEKIEILNHKIQDLQHEHILLWYSDIVFTWRWWLGITISFAAWLFWWKFHKRNSRHLLLYAGIFVMVVSIILDSIGVQIGLWSYEYKVTPFLPAYLPYDLALMPVTIMSLIQYKPHISVSLKGLIFSLGSAFIAEPFITWIDIYEAEKWKSIYSVPLYFLIYLIANYLTTQKGFNSIKE